MLGDYGGADNNTFSSLWEALPSVAVVGGQVRLKFQPIVFFFLLHYIIFNFKALGFCDGEWKSEIQKKMVLFCFLRLQFSSKLKIWRGSDFSFSFVEI